MRIKTILLFVVLLASVFFMAACTEKEEQRTTHVKIGAILPLSGWGAYWGNPVLQGMQLAVQDIEKDYPGQVLLIVEDDQSDSKTVATAANKLRPSSCNDYIFS